MMIRRITYFIIFASIIICSSVQAEEIKLTLDEAIAIALRDNRDILLKTQDLKKAKTKLAEAESAVLPNLSFGSTLTQTRGYYNKDLSQLGTQVSLKQVIYKGGSIVNTIRQSKHNLEIVQSVLDRTKLELVLNVKKAFYTLILAQEFCSLNKDILDNIEKHLDALQRRYLSGQVPESEILKIRESKVRIQQAYGESLNQIEAIQQVLKNLLYLDESVLIKPQGSLNYDVKEIAYDEAFLRAMQLRPEIKQYEAQVKLAEASKEIVKSASRPTVYVSWDYYSRSHSPGLAGISKGWNDYNTISLVFSCPIFDGWATQHKLEQAISDLKSAQLMKEKVIKDVTLELKEAYLELKDAILKIKSSQAELDLYSDNLKTTKKKYEQGIASALDLDDATLSYKVSMFNQNQAIYDYLLAEARFNKATGGNL